MRIPLIVGWDARLNKRGPTVSLQAGKYRIHSSFKGIDNAPIATVDHCTDPMEPFALVDQLCIGVVKGGCSLTASFSPSFKESGISIYLEKYGDM